FRGCTALTAAPALNATTLADYCYYTMFYGCTGLVTAPSLPAATCATSCYQGMFRECSSLSETPTLAATTLAPSCYYRMFYSCTSLERPCGLPATTLADACYYEMFRGCSGIKASQTLTGSYVIPYRVPSSGAGVTANTPMTNMFAGTGGTFTGTPTINTTYYLYDPRPTLASGTTWYKGTTAKNTITEIEIRATGAPSGTITEQWHADTNDSGAIECYIIGTKLYIVGNVANGIKANPDSTQAFYGFTAATSFTGVGNLDTAFCTNMSYMFGNLSNLTSLDVSSLNTASCTNMAYMFANDSKLTTINVTGFNTASVQNMSNMFYNCMALSSLNVSNFNTANVTNMSNMFYYCNALTGLNLSSFNTAKVQNMSYMFRVCSNITTLDLSSFSNAALTNVNYMFYGCSKLEHIYVSRTNFPDKTYSSGSAVFTNCTKLIHYLSGKVTGAYAIIDNGMNYGYLEVLGETVPVYTTAMVYNAGGGTSTNAVDKTTITAIVFMNSGSVSGYSSTWNADFYGTGKYKGYLKGTTVYIVGDGHGSITLYPGVFNPSSNDGNNWGSGCTYFYQCYNLANITGLTLLDTSHVVNMASMFSGCTSLQSVDLSNFNTSNVRCMRLMFSRCDSLQTIDIRNFDTSKCVSLSWMFTGNLSLSGAPSIPSTGVALQNLYLPSNFVTSTCLSTTGMFSNCKNLTSIDLSKFNTSSCTEMYSMFTGCSGLTSLQTTYLNTSSCTNVSYMFSGCTGLTSLDLSSFNTSNVGNTTQMFNECSNLATIYASTGWNMNNVTTSTNMFKGCTRLPNYNASYLDKTRAHYNSGGYLTYKAAKSMSINSTNNVVNGYDIH
ncbi:MAG: DUF285 domain-containing protein, partial [Clostridia bacterium]|nr:DUF285 domain-containing protein [Clostridia bacterium]